MVWDSIPTHLVLRSPTLSRGCKSRASVKYKPHFDMCKAISNISNQRHDSKSTDDNVYSEYLLPKNLGGNGVKLGETDVGHPREIWGEN